MTRIVLISCALVFVIGCHFDTTPIVCATDDPSPSCHPDAFVEGDAHVDAFAADADAAMTDAFVDPDGGVDGGNDAGSDAGVDAFMPDAFVEPDTSVPDAGVRRCEGTTSGVCIRFHNMSGDMAIMGWNAQFVWTRTGGSILMMPSDGSYASSCSTFRVIDADTTECEITIPDPGTPVLSAFTIFAFPVYPAAIPACSNTASPACPNFPGGYLMWHDGVSVSTVPADGHFSIANRPYASGMLRMIQITLP